MKIEITSRYKALIEWYIELIDEKVQEAMYEYDGDLTNTDLTMEIGNAIIDELESSGLDMKINSKLKRAVVNDLVLNYVRYMYSEWYTGDMEEVDMVCDIGRYVNSVN